MDFLRVSITSCLPILFCLTSTIAPTPHLAAQASLHKIMGKEAKDRKGGMEAAQERGRGQEEEKERRQPDSHYSSKMSEFQGSTVQLSVITVSSMLLDS